MTKAKPPKGDVIGPLRQRLAAAVRAELAAPDAGDSPAWRAYIAIILEELAAELRDPPDLFSQLGE